MDDQEGGQATCRGKAYGGIIEPPAGSEPAGGLLDAE